MDGKTRDQATFETSEAEMYLRLQSSCSAFMMLCNLLAALNLSSQLHNAHPGITQLLIHVLHIESACC